MDAEDKNERTVTVIDNTSFNSNTPEPAVNESLPRQMTNDSYAEITSGLGSRNESMDPDLLVEQEKLARPLYDPKKPPEDNSESRTNVFGRIFLTFMLGTKSLAEKMDDKMEVEDLEPLIGADTAGHGHNVFSKCWKEEVLRSPTEPSPLRALWAATRGEIFAASFGMFLESGMAFAGPVLLYFVNQYVTDRDAPMWHGGVIAVVLFAVRMLLTAGSAITARMMARLSLRIQNYLCMEVMSKTISLSQVGLANVPGGTGRLFQVFQTDITVVSESYPWLIRSVDIMLQIIGVFIYLGFVVGWPACGVVFVFLVLLPVNYQLTSGVVRLFIAKFIAGDGRTKKIVELIHSIRVVKFYAWEKPFSAVIAKMRAPELKTIGDILTRMALISFSFATATPLLQVVLFFLMAVDDSDGISIAKFFQALSLMAILSVGLIQVPFIYSHYLQVQESLRRLRDVLLADDVREKASLAGEVVTLPLGPDHKKGEVSIASGTFSWTVEETSSVPPASPSKEAKDSNLENVNFSASNGDLVLMIGKVGSGKTSIISAILAESICVEGKVSRIGRIAYVPQQAWILNATVRNNITMNSPFDQAKYDRVIKATSLAVDFESLPNGDLTEIGEKGINLSGGQKQRVSIARSLYMDADVYLFDDPLSALDAHVGRHVFNDAILGLLAGKTRVFVTHQMNYIPSADKLYLMEDMKCLEENVPSNLQVSSEPVDGESSLAQLLRAWDANSAAQEEEEEEGEAEGGDAEPAAVEGTVVSDEGAARKKKKKSKGKKKVDGHSGALTVREERESGQVKSSTFFRYLRSYGGPEFWVPMITIHLVVVALVVFSQLWLPFWTNEEWPELNDKYDAPFFIGIYALIIFVMGLFVLLREIVWRTGAVNAPRRMYQQMTDAILHAPLSFFDVTPAGRIINRFTKDSNQVDTLVSINANQVLVVGLNEVGRLIAICVFVPYFIPIAVVLLIVILLVQPSIASTVARRLYNSTNGPVAGLFSEVVGGTTSIRCFGMVEFFTDRLSQKLNDSGAAYYTDKLMYEMLRLKLNVVVSFLMVALVLMIMGMKDDISALAANFIVTQGFQMSLYLQFFLIQRTMLSLALNSVERMFDYIEVESEESQMQKLCTMDKDGASSSGGKLGLAKPDKEWPQKGSIEVKDLCVRYRPGLPYVLQSVSVSLRSGEKIGVCGRTGSGKSTFLLALFRLVPVLKGSQILIDGVDVTRMPLESLRTQLSAIPQEPILFSGTVRENLDPFSKQSNEDLWKAIEMCHLSDILVKLLPEEDTKDAAASSNEPDATGVSGIASKNVEDGKEAIDITKVLELTIKDENFSAGQKQLLCLARAVCKKVKILMLDEATSSVDVHTDQLIQQTIRSAFADCTVITIAHRLNTIMDSDRVIVLEAGKLLEFDAPSTLMKDSTSAFASLARDAKQQEQEEAA